MKAFTFIITVMVLTTFSSNAQNAMLKTNEITMQIENEDGQISIQWNTQREVNTRYFIIEKSVDGMSYTILATKEASGNSMFPRMYSFTDMSAPEVAFYRIRMVTMESGSSYSNIVAYHQFRSNDKEKPFAQK